MARKRMISPEIWRDKKVVKLSNTAFILFIGCISTADDEGIIEPSPDAFYFELARKELTVDLIEDAFNELYKSKMVLKYGDYAFLPSWFKHQSLEKPSKTKRKRPPRELVESNKDYLEGWEYTFSKKDKNKKIITQSKYPFETCFTIDRVLDDMSSKGCRVVEPKGKERKGKENNIKEDNDIGDPTPAESNKKSKLENKHPPEKIKLYNEVLEDFEKVYGDLPNYGKEGPHIYSLINRGEKILPGGEREFIRDLIRTLVRLKKTQKDFWKDQPVLPSIVNSESIYPRILEHMKTARADPELLKLVDEIIPSKGLN